MKKTRKGFTLVELLIVVAILATLAGVMMTTITGQTAKAKAAAIVHNVDACKKAAMVYYSTYWNSNDDMKDATAKTVLDKYVPNHADFNVNGITYTPDETKKGVSTEEATKGIPLWEMTVDFASDGEAAEIQKALEKIPGYVKVEGNKTAFTVNIYTGVVTVN